MKYFLSYIFLIFCCALTESVGRSFSTNAYEVFEANGKVGMQDDRGNVVIPAKYDELGWSKGELIPINNTIGYRLEDSWGLISLKNEMITKPSFSQLYNSGAGFLVAARQGKITKYDFLGLISTEAKQILPFKYTSIEIVGLRAIVSTKTGKKYRFGLVDFGNKIILPIAYNEIKSLGSLRFAVTNADQKIAIYSDQGTQIRDFSLDSISGFVDGYAYIFQNHNTGLMNTSGQFVIEPKYKSVRIDNGQLEAKDFNLWQALDQKNKIIASWNYDNIMPYSQDKYITISNGKSWIIRRDGQALSALNNDYISREKFSKSIFRIGNKWGLLRSDGSEVLPAVYDSLLVDHDMVYVMRLKRNQYKWSLYDTFAIKKSEYEYDFIGKKTRSFYPVRRNGFWGFIDRSGEEFIHCVYDEVKAFVGNNVIVKFHGDYGVIDKYGEWKVLPQQYPLELINDDLYLIRSPHLTTLKSIESGTIYFSNNRIETKKGYLLEHLSEGGVWKIDFAGRIVKDTKDKKARYQEIRPPSEGLYVVKIDGSYGFIDHENRLLISNRYEDLGSFSEGLAAFKLRGRWGYIDKNEKIIIQPLYDERSDYSDGVAVVSRNGKYGVIDVKGRLLISTEYDDIEKLENGRFLIEKNGLFGLLHKSGKLAINVKYESVKDLNNGQVIVKKFGQYGVVDLYGVDIIPTVYDDLKFDPRFGEYLAMKKSKWAKTGVK